MSICTDSNKSGGLRPNLSCPPDLSQLLFRFINRKRLGVVKGKDELAALDMSLFFIPLNGYMMTQWDLPAGDSMRIEAGSSMNFGKRREITQFDISNDFTVLLGVNTTAELKILDGTTVIGNLTGLAADDFATLSTAIKDAIFNDDDVKAVIEWYTDNSVDIFSLRGKTDGKDYTYEFKLTDSTGPTSETVAGTETQTALRYPNGAWKTMFMAVTFCSDCSASNQQYIEYAYDSDVIANGESGATWRPVGPMLFLSGAEDIEETDTNMVETIWVRNTQACDVEIQAILAT